MERLYRIRIRPRGPWRTPWQADTLTGLLCWMCARTEGESVLRQEIIEPMLAGRPPFVLSDAFPGNLLPVPIAIRLYDWPAEDRKTVKRAAWLRSDAFVRVCRGNAAEVADLLTESPIVEGDQTRNTISRVTDSTGEAGGLFTLTEYRLDPTGDRLTGRDEMSIYVRTEPQASDLLLDLFAELATVGFGADASVGKGAFDFPAGAPHLEPVDLGHGNGPAEARSVIVLSTFQPGEGDPTEGYWESFVKFGKLGAGLGTDLYEKRPMVLFRPGACFSVAEPTPAYVGRAIPMDEFLEPEAIRVFRERGVELIHPAFGLAIPANLR